MVNTQITHQALAELVGGTLAQGDPHGVIVGLNSLADAVPGEVSFLGNSRYASQIRSTGASAVLVSPDFADAVEGKALVRVSNPTLAFDAVIKFFGPPPRAFVAGVHASAIVADSAQLDRTAVQIGPGAVVEDDARIGDRTVIHARVYIGPGVTIGADCVLHAGVVIKDRCVLGDRVVIHSGSVIGTDGFGYQTVKGRHLKIDQAGIVQIDNDVEIGSCTTIDRARFGRTHIGEGTKIDNLVQIGHNVRIGKHCIIVSQTGISGSTRIGNYVVMGGQVGVAGHLEIADQVSVLAKSGITKNLSEPGAYTGYPAKPLMEGRRLLTYPARVPELIDRVRQLERRLEDLEGRSAEKA